MAGEVGYVKVGNGRARRGLSAQGLAGKVRRVAVWSCTARYATAGEVRQVKVNPGTLCCGKVWQARFGVSRFGNVRFCNVWSGRSGRFRQGVLMRGVAGKARSGGATQGAVPYGNYRINCKKGDVYLGNFMV